MIARKEAVKVLYTSDSEEKISEPVAVIINGSRTPVIYGLTRLDSDQLANLYESGDPEKEQDVLVKGSRHGDHGTKE